MSELLEHQLNQLKGRWVSIVRPGYGTQSDSWSGNLYAVEDNYPLKFHFVSSGISILFTSEDVVKVEDDCSAINIHPLIRLKGPQDYKGILEFINK